MVSGAVTPVLRLLRTGRNPPPERVRGTLEELGPTFVKLGQYLALRPDLISQEYCDEFLGLVDVVKPEPFAAVRQAIEADLGAGPDQLFAWLNPQPTGAASLAQVHEARTHAGAEVAVKVQRPDVGPRVERDLSRVRVLGRLVEQTGLSGAVPTRDVVSELSRWMREELDMRRELRNVTRLWELSRDSRVARVPQPFPDLSGSRVLTTEYFHGVPFSELLRLVRAGRPERIGRMGLDREVLAANLIEAVLEQIFRFELFHADTHPGNLIALPGNAIGFVDFGLVETLDPTVRRGLRRYLQAIYAGDVEGVLRGVMELLVPTEHADPEGFKTAFLEETRRLRRERAVAPGDGDGDGGEHSAVGRYLFAVLGAARRHGLRVPQELLSMYRSLLTAETIAHRLDTGADLASVGRRFFARYEVDEALSMLALEGSERQVMQLAELLRDGPGQVQRLVSDLAEERFVLHVERRESPADLREASLRTRVVAVAVLSVGLALLLVGSAGMALGPVPLPAVLGVLLVGLYGWLMVLWRRLR